MRIKLYLSIIFILITLPKGTILANDNIRKIFNDIKNKEWVIATKGAQNIGNNALLQIVQSQKLLDSNNLDNNFNDIVKFLNKHPHWAEAGKLRKKAEQYLNANTDKKLILEWFKKYKPQTANGYRYYALAAASEPNNKDTIAIIKSALIYGDFTLDEEKKYFSAYRKYFNESDYIDRFNDYLWKDKFSLAKKILPLINPSYSMVLAATEAAATNSSSKEGLFSKVDPKYYLNCLLYKYLKSKKTERPTLNSLKLFRLMKKDCNYADDWSALQAYYAREFMDLHEYANAYKIVSSHCETNSELSREIDWVAGWLALRYVKNPTLALTHFNKFLSKSKRPISVARGEYWIGRAYDALKNDKLKNEHYNKAAKFSYTFYGQVSLKELGKNQLILPSPVVINESHRKKFENDEDIQIAKLWVKYGSFEMAHLYGRAAMEKAHTPEDAVLIAQFFINNHQKDFQKVMIAKEASYHGAFMKDIAYPTPYNLKDSPVDPSFAYAIIRQESVFHPGALSTAGAMGLMQLIKATACAQAKAIGITCDTKKLIDDPKYNILIGTSHLKHLLKYRNGSYILAICSYNANPKKVDRWVNLFGDPRKMKDMHQVIDWLESIPFSETRNYVQRVLEGIQIYHTLLNKNTKLTIADYLTPN